MEKQIFDIIRKYKPDATKSTIDSYVFYILKVCRDMGFSNNECKPSIFDDTKKVIDMVSKQSMNTQKTKLNAIVVYLKSVNHDEDVIDRYSLVIFKLLNKLRASSEKMKWNDKEKEKLVSITDLQLMVRMLKKRLPDTLNTIAEIHQWMDYITVSLVLLYPARNDYSDMLVKTEDEYTNDTNFNYLVIEKNKLKIILNKYKTQKTYGKIEYEIDDKILYNDVVKYYDAIKTYKKVDDYFLLFKKNFEKMSRNDYTKYLIRIFDENVGKKISSSMLRKIITSSLIDPSFVEMSKKQQHSPKEALNSYVKF